MIVIETERLILRKFRSEDFAALYAISSDPEVMEYFLDVESESETKKFIDDAITHFEEFGYSWFAIECKTSTKMIGFVGLYNVASIFPFAPAVEIGWRLDKNYWGNGYAPEAAQAVLAFGFKQHNIERIVAFTKDINENSRRVMDKLGMHYLADSDFIHPPGIDKTHKLAHYVLYEIYKQDFLSSPNSYLY